MAYSNRLTASERGIVMMILGVSLRPALISLYCHFLGDKIRKSLLGITLSLTLVESIFIIVPLVPSSSILVPTRVLFKFGVAIESMITVISIGLLIHSFTSPSSVWQQICAIILLLAPSIFRWWLHAFFYNLFFSCRKPIPLPETKSINYESIAMVSFEGEEQNQDGPLAAAYTEMMVLTPAEANHQGHIPTRPLRSVEETPPLSEVSAQPQDTIPSAQLGNTRPQPDPTPFSRLFRSPPVPLKSPPSQSSPRYHLHTSIFGSQLLEYLIWTSIVLAFLEICLAAPSIGYMSDRDISPFRQTYLPSLLSFATVLSLKLFLSITLFVYPLALAFTASFIMYFLAALSCKDICSDMTSTQGIIITLHGLQLLHLVLHIVLLGAPVAILMARRKCRCCSLSNCMVEAVTADRMERPYFLWRYDGRDVGLWGGDEGGAAQSSTGT